MDNPKRFSRFSSQDWERKSTFAEERDRAFEKSQKESLKKIEGEIPKTKLPKCNKQQLINYWKSIAILASSNLMGKQEIKQMVLKSSFSDPTLVEVNRIIRMAEELITQGFLEPDNVIDTPNTSEEDSSEEVLHSEKESLEVHNIDSLLLDYGNNQE